MSQIIKKNSIIYVNYSPYENAGKILDYLLGEFKYVFLFSIGFHYLGKKQETNKLSIYCHGKLKKEIFFKSFPIKIFTVILLPVRSLLNLVQLVWSTYLIKKKYGKIDVYFTVNGYTSWIGLIMKKLGLVSKHVYWVWDYYPLKNVNLKILLMRWLYWQFDKTGYKADRLIFLNKRLMNVWRNKKVIGARYAYSLVPIGTEKLNIKKHIPNKKRLKIGFIGVIKKSQGLDLLLDTQKELSAKYPKLRFEIIGSGPQLEDYRNKFSKSVLNVKFYGLTNEDKFKDILMGCDIGIAPYLPVEGNVSKYGDPAKIKWYLSAGLPSIITDVFEFSKTLENLNAGIIINYGNSTEFIEAIDKIVSKYQFYRQNAIKLSKGLYFNKIYKSLFNDIN
jgi:glycosyltransferase involved in cell wall biosynthesis